MTELQCPLCKSDPYLNPNIKIYISPCYHKMCESCLTHTFPHGQAPCPECGTMLRKINYTTQTFEDMGVERECKFRKMLRTVLYRIESEFEDVCEYNDYLEEFENYIEEMMVCEKRVDEIMEEMRKMWGENTKQNHANEKQVRLDKEEMRMAGRKRKGVLDEPVLGFGDVKKKRVDFGEDVSEGPGFNPLSDVKMPVVYVTQKHKIPQCFRINFLAGGYTENLVIFKGVNSVFDDEI